MSDCELIYDYEAIKRNFNDLGFDILVCLQSKTIEIRAITKELIYSADNLKSIMSFYDGYLTAKERYSTT